MTEEHLLYSAYLEKKGLKPYILDDFFPKQLEFIEDPARLKALFCTRRAAKSYTAGLHLVQDALNTDACNCLYLGLTRMSAKGIIWKDVLKIIDDKNELGIKFNHSELTATMKNGSVIYVTGADADEDEMEKLLGKKYKTVIIDEAASFSIDLRRMIYGILKPATIDLGGTICVMGTSGNLTKGLFFDITKSVEPGWKLWEWSAHDNPYVARQWQEELDDIATNRPLFMQTALFKQWYLNQWVIDTDKLVYKFNADRNLAAVKPHYSRGEWSYVLGVDLGYEDASAFALCAFHEFDKTLYVLNTIKKSKMDITDVAQKIKAFQSSFPIFKVIIDGANKQAVEEIQKRHGIALHSADKIGKSDFIEIMNAELIQGHIKLLKGQCDPLIDEWKNLIWDEKSAVKKEHAICENHLADAALYAWRYCYQFLSEKPKDQPNMKSKDQWLKHTEKLMEESLERQIKKQESEEKGNDYWNMTGMDSELEVMSYFLNKKRNS